jgi:hypothetical protein
MNTPTPSIDVDRNVGNFFYDLKPTRDAGVGLTERTIDYIVEAKGEPDWLRQFRNGAYRLFKSKPLPTHWAGDELKEIDFDRIRYYLASGEAIKSRLRRFLQKLNKLSSAPASPRANGSSWPASKRSLTAKRPIRTLKRPFRTRG